MPEPSSPVPDVKFDGDTAHYQDSARTTPATVDGDPIGSLTDTGALGPFHPSASGATRPVLLSNPGFKGHAGIQFGAAQNLVHATAPLANSRTKGTLLVAFRSDTSSPPGGAVFATTGNQLSLLNGGWRVALDTGNGDYGDIVKALGLQSLVGGQLCWLRYDGTAGTNATKLRFRRNLVDEELDYFAGFVHDADLPATTLAGGQNLYLGRETGGGGFEHTLLALRFWRGVCLSDAEILEWEDWAAAEWFTTTASYQVIASGDSNTVGPAGWPEKLTTDLGTGWATALNTGGAGLKWQNIVANPPGIAARNDWLTYQPLCAMLGTNDFFNDDTAANVEGYVTSWLAKVRNARFPVFIGTCLPCDVLTAPQRAEMDLFNTWLRTGGAGAEATIVETNTAIADPGNPDLMNPLLGDGLHLVDAGKQVVADVFRAAILAALEPGGGGLLREIVTLGFGWPVGVRFIPTLGFRSGAAEILIYGPACFVAGEVQLPGFQEGEVRIPGFVEGEVKA